MNNLKDCEICGDKNCSEERLYDDEIHPIKGNLIPYKFYDHKYSYCHKCESESIGYEQIKHNESLPRYAILNPKDLLIEVYRPCNCIGSMLVEGSNNVKITHIPTGIKSKCAEFRSQYKNRKEALKELERLVYEYYLEKSNSLK